MPPVCVESSILRWELLLAILPVRRKGPAGYMQPVPGAVESVHDKVLESVKVEPVCDKVHGVEDMRLHKLNRALCRELYRN